VTSDYIVYIKSLYGKLKNRPLFVTTMKVIVHYGEISLKGKNFPFFENTLLDNIRASCKKQDLKLVSMKKDSKRTICDIEGAREPIIEALRNVLGIKYFSFVKELPKELSSLKEYATEIMEELTKKGIETIRFETKRSDKSFSVTSVDVNKEYGAIANELGLKVDYKGSKDTIYTEISFKQSYMYTEKILGFGGLPVGVTGKVLCLLSGGIDSPVAAWNMMKRGCRVDFLHIHSLADNKAVMESKIKKTIDILNDYQFDSKLFVLPYSAYEILTQGLVEQKLDLVLFKHYILKLAEKIALDNKYDVIVTGDNLAQVASQTMENLVSTSHGITLPIFRPLLTYDKEEIISLAKNIGTFDISIEKYKDCCSILAKKPATKVRVDVLSKVLKGVNFSTLIDRGLQDVKSFNC